MYLTFEHQFDSLHCSKQTGLKTEVALKTETFYLPAVHFI